MKHLFLILFSIIVLFACHTKSPRDTALEKIRTLEKQLQGDSAGRLNYHKGNEIIMLYSEFAEKFPSDTNAADFLFQAGEVSMGIMQGQEAVIYFDILASKYPRNVKAPYALFLIGYTYETVIDDKTLAVEGYKRFIAAYPEHELVPDAEFSIKNIAKSPDELVREFQAKNPK